MGALAPCASSIQSTPRFALTTRAIGAPSALAARRAVGIGAPSALAARRAVGIGAPHRAVVIGVPRRAVAGANSG